MPSIKTLVPRVSSGQKKASIVDLNGLRWTFVHVPPQVEHLDQNLEWAVINRPGSVPLVERKGQGLARLRLSWLLGFPDMTVSIEDRLFDLKSLCRNGNLLRLDYGPLEDGWWRCVDLSWTTKTRNSENATTRADVQLELARAVDPDAGALVSLVRPSLLTPIDTKTRPVE